MWTALRSLSTFCANLTSGPPEFDKFSQLPPEIKLTILECLDFKSLKHASVINSEIHQYCQTPTIKNRIDEQRAHQKRQKQIQFIHTLFKIGDLSQHAFVDIKRGNEKWTLVHPDDGYSFYEGNWMSSYAALQASNKRYTLDECTEKVLTVLTDPCTIEIEFSTIDMAPAYLIDEIAELFSMYEALPGIIYYKDEDDIEISIDSNVFFGSF